MRKPTIFVVALIVLLCASCSLYQGVRGDIYSFRCGGPGGRQADCASAKGAGR